jgi:DNA-binding HxlR family transcriptional regulator
LVSRPGYQMKGGAAVRADTKDIARWFEIVQWLQGSWVPEIVIVLAEGPTRFQDLGRAIRAQNTDRWWSTRTSRLSNSQLSRTLHAMRVIHEPR